MTKYLRFTDAAQQIIKTQAAIKIVNVFPGASIDVDRYNPDPAGAHNLLKQLHEPATYRPVRVLDPKIDRTHIFNPKTKTWETRQVKPRRGMPKPGAEFTKNSSTTLLPPHAKMKLFSGSDPAHPPIGFLFDITQCDRKDDKYIGRGDLATRMKWWLDYSRVQSDFTKRDKEQIRAERSALQMSLEDLQQDLNAAAQSGEPIRDYNEAYVGLSRASLQALFLDELDYKKILAVIQMNLECKKYLDVHLPILIINPQEGFRELTNREQVMYLEQIGNSNKVSSETRDRAKLYLREVTRSEAAAFNDYQNNLAQPNSSNLSNLKQKYQTLQSITDKEKDSSLSELTSLMLQLLTVYNNNSDPKIKSAIFEKIKTIDTLYEIYKLDSSTLAQTKNIDHLISSLSNNIDKMNGSERAIVGNFMQSKILQGPRQIEEIRIHNERFLTNIQHRLMELQKSVGIGKNARASEWQLIFDKAQEMMQDNPLKPLEFKSIITQIGTDKLKHALETKSQGLWGKTAQKDSKNVATINTLNNLKPGKPLPDSQPLKGNRVATPMKPSRKLQS